jgi:hypothetical protein
VGEAAEGSGEGSDAFAAVEGEDDAAKQSEVSRRLSGAGGAGVLLHLHIFDPVEAVLDLPVTSDDGGQCFSGRVMAGDVVGGLGEWFPSAEAGAVDDDEGGEVGPEGERRVLGNGKDLDGSRGEAVAGPLGLGPGTLGRGTGWKLLDGVEEDGLVGFEGDQVVGAGGPGEGTSFFLGRQS